MALRFWKFYGECLEVVDFCLKGFRQLTKKGY